LENPSRRSHKCKIFLFTKKENEKVNFLSLLIENYPEILKEEGFLTISEESLKGTHGEGKKNYEHILSSAELVAILAKNYKDYGTSIKDAEITAYFHEQKTKAAEEQKNSYELLRKAFEIGDAKAADNKTPAATQDANAEKKEENAEAAA
jgi:2-polyprenyl-3-methyl-5-hydroxy-6-metoxy-1,4-benzoquinol methylase